MFHSLEQHTLEDVITTCKLPLPPLLHHTASHHTVTAWVQCDCFMNVIEVVVHDDPENQIINRK